MDFSEKAIAVSRRSPYVNLAYLFGSQASGQAGQVSDYDFAVYLDGTTPEAMSDCQLRLIWNLQKALYTDAIDLVALNTTESSKLKYDIIQNGIRSYEIDPYHVLVEPEILSEYFDFHEGLKRNGLTRSGP